MAILVCLAWFAQHERAQGKLAVEAKVAAAVAASEAVAAKEAEAHAKINADTIAGLQEELERVRAAASLPPPVVRLCSDTVHPSVLPAPAGAPSAVPGVHPASAANVSSVPGGDRVGPDVGASLQDLARAGDVLSAYYRALKDRDQELSAQGESHAQ